MQECNSVSMEVEYILFELSRCVNDLQSFQSTLSIDDAKNIKLNVRQLESLISLTKES
ncbi:hypothetical protein [Legionella longbeachae]|uniref:hypothetical protein n=1 Tax=Legionella longbeachae TaxID=450 RepID=UPI000F701100|nr:hypothetical protein [Legionella longbeachae]UAK46027.1 hypothetical protein K8O86_14820 [Legionella longbeachae]VEE02998.1 Uncharacterised protein [Legionella oakridgensis]